MIDAASRVLSGLSRADRAAFAAVARHRFPGGDRVLPRLSRSADHGVLWFATAAAIAAAGVGGRRAAARTALRGAASLALASAAANVFAKRAVRRGRPLPDAVPVLRRLHRPPFTSSFPSGHTASAAAFATGVALESRPLGAAVAPLAAAVAFSRVYTGAHYPGDVLAGAVLGVAAAHTVRRMVPPAAQVPPRVRAPAPAPALPEGAGLVVVANAHAGPPDTRPDRLVADVLPRAEVLTYGGTAGDGAGDRDEDGAGDGGAAGAADGNGNGGRRGDGDARARAAADETPREADGSGAGAGELPRLLRRAARRAAGRGGALGVLGGDGSVNAAAEVALEYDLPLAVFPGGTFNHFAHDVGVGSARVTGEAVTSGEAVRVDVARFGDGADARIFLNTFAIGVYPELVRLREHWRSRIGPWPAGVLAAWRVLRSEEPVELVVHGRPRRLWLLFAGNCRYATLGLARQRRNRLDDGLLDIRVARADRWARTRLLAAALTGTLYRTPVHGAALLSRFRIDRVLPATHLAYDGEVADAPARLLLSKERAALRVYCPLGERTVAGSGNGG